MTTALAPEPQVITRPELAALTARESEIAQLAAEYMPLKINGLDDRHGFSLVHSARMKVKAFRVAIEKKRVELKADALAYSREVDAAAKKMFALIEPIEAHLEAEEQAITDERARIKREAEEAKDRKRRERWAAMAACGPYDMAAVEAMTDEQFAAELAKAQAAKAERDRIEAEAAELRRQQEAELAAERERLAKIKAEQEALAEQQRAEAGRLAAARLAIEQREAEERRQAELAKAREEAAERARIETEQRLAREEAERKAAEQRAADEARAKAEREEQARLKAEAERPHREKLLAVADAVLAITVPDGPQSSAVAAILRVAAGQVKKIAMGPLEP